MKKTNVFGMDSRVFAQMKSAANRESKAEARSLKNALNAVKDAAARKDCDTRRFLEAIQLPIDVLNAIEWQSLEATCRKSSTGFYCTWFVWEWLINNRRSAIIREIEGKKAAEKAAREAKRVNERAKRVKAKRDTAAKKAASEKAA